MAGGAAPQSRRPRFRRACADRSCARRPLRSWCGNRMAQGPERVRPRCWSVAELAGNPALPAASGEWIQTLQPARGAALGLSPVRRGALRMGTSGRARRSAALFDHLPHLV